LVVGKRDDQDRRFDPPESEGRPEELGQFNVINGIWQRYSRKQERSRDETGG
jgi:hypothetical protein